MKFKALIFDFFGVVATDMYISWLEGNALGKQIPDMIKSHFQHSDTGAISPTDLHSHLASNVGRPVPDIEAELGEQFSLNQEVALLIKSLRPKFKIALCSNAPTGVVEEFLEKNNVSELFDVIVISSTLGVRKPDRAIFEETLKRLGVTPEEAIFIDDNEENVKAAEKIGMKSILFTNSSDIKQELAEVLK